jgi:hypothetical protein
VVVGKLRAIHSDHIVLGGGVRILLPAHITTDGLEVGASLTVVIHENTDRHLVAESIRKTPDGLLGGQPA